MEEEDLSFQNPFFLQSANNTNPKQQEQPKPSTSKCNCNSSSSITQQKLSENPSDILDSISPPPIFALNFLYFSVFTKTHAG
jgi:hypothetical protein